MLIIIYLGIFLWWIVVGIPIRNLGRTGCRRMIWPEFAGPGSGLNHGHLIVCLVRGGLGLLLLLLECFSLFSSSSERTGSLFRGFLRICCGLLLISWACNLHLILILLNFWFLCNWSACWFLDLSWSSLYGFLSCNYCWLLLGISTLLVIEIGYYVI